MVKQGLVKASGKVVKALPNATFEVAMVDGSTVLARTSGKMRRFRIHILPGDRVDVEMSMHDLTRGRIVYRYK